MDSESNRSKAAKSRTYNPCSVCQKQRKKCDGGMPCQWCRDIRKKPDECKLGQERKKNGTGRANNTAMYPDIGESPPESGLAPPQITEGPPVSSTFTNSNSATQYVPMLPPIAEDVVWFETTSATYDALQGQDWSAFHHQSTMYPEIQQSSSAFQQAHNSPEGYSQTTTPSGYHGVQPQFMSGNAESSYPVASASGHVSIEHVGAHGQVSYQNTMAGQEQVPISSFHTGGHAGWDAVTTTQSSFSPQQFHYESH